jgi:glycosyltransferase involved in cell wall biosynthesis
VRVAAIIPAYNEGEHIGEVVERAKRYVDHVIVVDDGSVDDTAERARLSGAEVIVSPKNEGKASAIKRGRERCKDFEAVIIMDGDLQHLPEEIPRLLECLEENDLCLGSRLLDSKKSVLMPLANRLSNKFASILISLLCGMKITDPQSGFRAIKMDKLMELELKAERYAIEHIMILEAAARGLRIKEVPISCVYGKEKTGIKPIRDTLRVTYYICAFMLRRAVGIWRGRYVQDA